MKFSFYQTDPALHIKALCALTEKSFYNDDRILIFTESSEKCHEVDKVLWTYSQKHFLPHAQLSDEVDLMMQPILLANNDDDISIVPDLIKRNVIIFNEPKDSVSLKKYFAHYISLKESANMHENLRLIFIGSEILNHEIYDDLRDIILKSGYGVQASEDKQVFEIFKQTDNGKWQKL